jgi:SAM-dependent methyltransferase
VLTPATIGRVRCALRSEEVITIAQKLCDLRVSTLPNARVLDAGSGLRSYVVFPPNVEVTGVDVSEALLNANPRLDVRICADLQKVELPPCSYDCVVCWEVLEHLPDPEPVVAKLAAAVDAGGLLLIGSPERASVKGLVTRLTPHSFHSWVYRRFFGLNPRDDAGPYPTFMRAGTSAESVRLVARRAGLTPLYVSWSESPMQVQLRRRLRLTGRVWRALSSCVHVVSVGRVSLDATDYLCIFERPASAS